MAGGKSLKVLGSLLAIVAIAGGVIFWTRGSKERTISSMNNRMAVSSAFIKAVQRKQQATGTWPKGLDEVKDDPDVVALSSVDLGQSKYVFVENKDKGAKYQFTYAGKTYPPTFVPPLMPKVTNLPKPKGANGLSKTGGPGSGGPTMSNGEEKTPRTPSPAAPTSTKSGAQSEDKKGP